MQRFPQLKQSKQAPTKLRATHSFRMAAGQTLLPVVEVKSTWEGSNSIFFEQAMHVRTYGVPRMYDVALHRPKEGRQSKEGMKRFCTNALHTCPSVHVPSFRSVKGISAPHAGQSSGAPCGTSSGIVQSFTIRRSARAWIEGSSENCDRRACSSVRRAKDEPDATHEAPLDL